MESGQANNPLSPITMAASFFGVGRLDFRLTKADRKRLAYASILPGLVLLCNLILLLLQAFKSIPYDDAQSFGPQSSFWWHIFSFVSTIVDPLPALAVGLLVLSSIYPVNRTQGSLAFAIAALLLALCLGFSVLAAVPTFLYEPYESIQRATDWYSVNTSMLALDTGFLAIGYAFFAYRGLSRSDVGRRVYGQRRRYYPQPSDGE